MAGAGGCRRTDPAVDGNVDVASVFGVIIFVVVVVVIVFSFEFYGLACGVLCSRTQ